MADLREIVNTDVYPLTNDTSAAEFQEFVERLHRRLETDGVVFLPDFMTKKAIEQTVLNAKKAAKTPAAFRSSIEHTVYNEENGEVFDAEHPRNYTIHSTKTCIMPDSIDNSGPLNVLYRSDEMTEFVRGILGQPVLYRTADHLGDLNIHVFNDQDRLGWHFDRGQFAVTLLLQAPKKGGIFQYAPALRSDESENYDEVKEILQEAEAGRDLSGLGVKQISLKPGTLAVFDGHHALHRVTPVLGDTPRIAAVLSYEKKSGVQLNEYTRMKFCGRPY